ncbi:RNA helicase [Handroanthus impetiginosus]|uniref:RNA helicase n=1 Tax=Handroanthus impetiginosus TaxID=429701 RepID=A0A2G9FY39_9LAMI|nr:RNA helicase [Handroanthus impetiginosus]
MDLLPFGDDDEAPNLLFNSEDSNQSWRDKHDRKENNSVSTEGESSQPLANTFEEIEEDEHTRNLNEARERRERARRFAPFLGKARDLQRVWARKNPKSVKCKFDSLPKKSKRKDKQTPGNSVVYETPMIGYKRACFRENNKGDKENSVSKALFQDN